MVWIDSVFSTPNHTPKAVNMATVKMAVVVQRLTPKLSTRLSVMRVPTTLMRTMESQ